MIPRCLAALWILATPVLAQITSWKKEPSRAVLTLMDGSAVVEFVSDSSIRYIRSWDVPITGLGRLSDADVAFEAEDKNNRLTFRTEHLVVEIPRDTPALLVRRRGGETLIEEAAPARRQDGVIILDRKLPPNERFSGLNGVLATRGVRLTSSRARLMSTAGYGEAFPSLSEATFDFGKTTLTRTRIEISGAPYLEQMITTDAAPKGILEEWANYLDDSYELKSHFLDPVESRNLPPRATRMDNPPLSSWTAFDSFFRKLPGLSLSAILYPAFDPASLPSQPTALRARLGQFAAMFPLLIDSKALSPAERMSRKRWMPYLITYAREAFDRGFPMLRPLTMQFPRDARLRGVDDVIMLGDELLLVPPFDDTNDRDVELPMGTWTDWYSGKLYPGRQRTRLSLPADRLPIFVKNGSLVPFDPVAPHARMELHYFPNVGGEFFLWEPDVEQNSQFHASPALDAIRLEIESKVTRTYEWIVRHARMPQSVNEGSREFRRVSSADELAPQTWFYDAARRELHVVLKGEAGADPIVMVTFPPEA